MDFVLTGNSATTTGNVLKLSVTGTSSAATALAIVNLGTGLSADISGAIAFRTGVAYTTVGVTNDAPFGDTSLVKLAGATAQTITGIAGGTDGQIMTIMNTGGEPAIFSNQSTGSAAANRIITGTGVDLAVSADQSIMMQYDGAAAGWRVSVGGSNIGAGAIVNNVQIISFVYYGSHTVMDSSSRYGMDGAMFIYNNQLYTMGDGATGIPYGNSAWWAGGHY